MPRMPVQGGSSMSMGAWIAISGGFIALGEACSVDVPANA